MGRRFNSSYERPSTVGALFTIVRSTRCSTIDLILQFCELIPVYYNAIYVITSLNENTTKKTAHARKINRRSGMCIKITHEVH